MKRRQGRASLWQGMDVGRPACRSGSLTDQFPARRIINWAEGSEAEAPTGSLLRNRRSIQGVTYKGRPLGRHTTTMPAGLGCFNAPIGVITLIQGWNWYAGADPSQISVCQFGRVGQRRLRRATHHVIRWVAPPPAADPPYMTESLHGSIGARCHDAAAGRSPFP